MDIDPSREEAPSDQAQRRRALKGAGIGVGTITLTHWIAPVVESVLLPAHAQTTTEVPDDEPDDDPAEVARFSGSEVAPEVASAPGLFRENPLAGIIPEALADSHQTGAASFRVTTVGDDAFRVTHVNEYMDVRRSGVIPADGSAGELELVESLPCVFLPVQPIPARIESFDSDEMILILPTTLNGRNVELRYVVPAGNAALPDLTFCNSRPDPIPEPEPDPKPPNVYFGSTAFWQIRAERAADGVNFTVTCVDNSRTTRWSGVLNIGGVDGQLTVQELASGCRPSVDMTARITDIDNASMNLFIDNNGAVQEAFVLSAGDGELPDTLDPC